MPNLLFLLNNYSFFDNEETEEIDEYLKKNDINVEDIQKKIGDMISKAKAELKFEKGKELQNNFNTELINLNKEKENNKTEYKIAARNFEELNENDSKIINENSEILKKISGKEE